MSAENAERCDCRMTSDATGHLAVRCFLPREHAGHCRWELPASSWQALGFAIYWARRERDDMRACLERFAEDARKILER